MSVSVYGLGAAHASLILNLVHKLKNTVLQNALLILSIVNKFKNTVLQNVRGSVDAAAESTREGEQITVKHRRSERYHRAAPRPLARVRMRVHTLVPQ